MIRRIAHRLERLESRSAARDVPPVSVRIRFVHPQHGLTGVLLLEPDKPATRVAPTPEERESVRVSLEQGRAKFGPLPRTGSPE